MIGLAVARAAALAGDEVIVAEAAIAIGTGISSRYSEVLHAGMYYPTGSRRPKLVSYEPPIGTLTSTPAVGTLTITMPAWL